MSTYPVRLDAALQEIIGQYDLVIDCTGNSPQVSVE